MTSRDFCYWLQGYFEVRAASKPGPETLSPDQVEMIKRHLALVFIHEIDPSFPKEQKTALDTAHTSDTEVKPYDPHTDSTTFGGVGPNGMLYRC